MPSDIIWSVFSKVLFVYKELCDYESGRLTSDVLFSIVAFKTLHISQGSVTTHLSNQSPDSESEIILKTVNI